MVSAHHQRRANPRYAADGVDMADGARDGHRLRSSTLGGKAGDVASRRGLNECIMKLSDVGGCGKSPRSARIGLID